MASARLSIQTGRGEGEKSLAREGLYGPYIFEQLVERHEETRNNRPTARHVGRLPSDDTIFYDTLGGVTTLISATVHAWRRSSPARPGTS